MRISTRQREGDTDNAAMTPMIDVIFQLLIPVILDIDGLVPLGNVVRV